MLDCEDCADRVPSHWRGIAVLVGLAGSLAMAQELAWPPSTPDGEPHIDHTRKVLNCSGGGCRLTVVRSQEELLQAMGSLATFSPAPTVPELQLVSSGISEEQAAEIQQRIQNSQQQTSSKARHDAHSRRLLWRRLAMAE